MQRKWYRSVLEKDIDAVNGSFIFFSVSQERASFNSIMNRIERQEGRQDAIDEYRHAAPER